MRCQGATFFQWSQLYYPHSIQLSPLGYQLSAIGYRLSPIGYQLSAIGYRLSPIGYQLSAIGYRLSPIAYRLSAISYRLSPINSGAMLHLQETFSDVVKTDKTGLSKTAHTRWMISAFANFLPGSTIFRLA